MALEFDAKSLKRWGLVLRLSLLACASYLVASTLNLFVEDSLRPPPQPASIKAAVPKGETPSPVMSGENLARLFGMTPAPEASPAEGPPDAGPQLDLTSEPVRSDLQAQLLATVVANRPEWSLATLRDLTANKTGIFMVGDAFMEARVVAIEPHLVVLLRDGHREFIDLNQPAGSPNQPASSISQPAISTSPPASSVKPATPLSDRAVGPTTVVRRRPEKTGTTVMLDSE
jgi:hypothetical protein